MTKRDFKKKQKRLMMVSKVALYGGMLIGVLLMCVGFVLGGPSAIIGTIAAGFACGVLGITAGVLMENKAHNLVYKDNDQNEKEVEVKEYQSENDQQLKQMTEQKIIDEKQAYNEDNLTL